jgi:hypothetical protein
MSFESSISLTNASERKVIFHVEPWGEEIEMLSGATFVVGAEAEQPGSFEVEHGDAAITVWAWSSAVVNVLSGDKEIGISGGIKRPAVPAVPEGQSVSSFLRSVLGKEGEV